jgi:hypothetical protein
MAMNLLKEVKSVINYFKSRQGLSCSEDSSNNIRNSFVASLTVQIQALPALTPADAAQVFEMLKESPYGVEGTSSILDAIDTKLVPSPQARRLKACSKCPTALEVSLELPNTG